MRSNRDCSNVSVTAASVSMPTIRWPDAPPARILALTMRSWPARASTTHMLKASHIAIAIGTTTITMLWRKFTDRAEAMVSMRSPWRGADNAERNDGVIVGASSLEHLRHNLTAVTEGPLPVC